MASAPASVFGHESGMALDGKTFYPTSISTDQTTAVDLSDPRLPRPIWQGQFNTHGMSVSDDGNRGYLATGDGLVIIDLSEVQARKPNPQVREISRLTWSNMTIPQIAIPVTIGGKPYLVEIDEYSSGESGGSVAGNGPRVGAARIIDISDERRPFVVSNIRLAVHQPENRAAIAGDPGAQSPVQGYAGHYCNVPQRVEPGILACSMIVSGPAGVRHPRSGAPEGDRLPRRAAVDDLGRPARRSSTSARTTRCRSPRSRPSAARSGTRTAPAASTRCAWIRACGRSRSRAGPAGAWSATGSPRSRRARAAGASQVSFTRRVERPVHIDVVRASDGRRVARRERAVHVEGPPRGRLRRALHDAGRSPRGRARPRRRRAVPRAATPPAARELWAGAQLQAPRAGVRRDADRLVPVGRAGTGLAHRRRAGRKVIKRFELDRRSFRFALRGCCAGTTRCGWSRGPATTRSPPWSPRGDCDASQLKPRRRCRSTR